MTEKDSFNQILKAMRLLLLDLQSDSEEQLETIKKFYGDMLASGSEDKANFAVTPMAILQARGEMLDTAPARLKREFTRVDRLEWGITGKKPDGLKKRVGKGVETRVP